MPLWCAFAEGWIHMRSIVCTIVRWGTLVTQVAVGQAPTLRKLELDDVYRLREVGDPQLSPDGAWVAYTVSQPDTARIGPTATCG